MKHPVLSDDTCGSVMETSYPVLTSGMTLSECLQSLVKNQVLAMPVVDDDGRYIGQFRKNLLIAAILPQVAVHDPRFDRIARMIDGGMLTETMEDVRERFSVISDKSVRRYLDTDTPVLRPDQPLVTAMFYLFHGRNFLPVVEPASGLLVGVISAWDILDSILKKD
ncbi:MAG: CBS domain-containing protein [Terrimicrobiaceae bacterium]|nr:CBS domain-containing protein [Terrimicrobiaceae bacterium]